MTYQTDNGIEMGGVREYCEEMPVRLCTHDTPNGKRLVVGALNECGHNGTEVDLLDLIAWVKKNKPELLVGDAT